MDQYSTSPPRDWKSASILNADGEDIKRRCGRPFSSSFKYIERHLFLPNLTSMDNKNALKPSVLFVQQDIIKGFFSSRVNSLKMTHGQIRFEPIGFPEYDEEPISA